MLEDMSAEDLGMVRTDPAYFTPSLTTCFTGRWAACEKRTDILKGFLKITRETGVVSLGWNGDVWRIVLCCSQAFAGKLAWGKTVGTIFRTWNGEKCPQVGNYRASFPDCSSVAWSAAKNQARASHSESSAGGQPWAFWHPCPPVAVLAAVPRPVRWGLWGSPGFPLCW